MIKTQRRNHGVQMINAWFADERIKDKGIITYKEAKLKIGRWEEFFTLITDLTESEETIKSHFAKNCKYKVNRAYREDVKFVMNASEDITNEDIDEYILFFSEFWKSKDSSLENPNALIEEMRSYRDTGGLTITKAYVEGELAIYHTYVNDDKCARLFHSASLYRLTSDEDGSKKNIIGMANRALHYEDMLFFKNKGLIEYDWGGAGKGEEVASITEFKESFGGMPVTYYDCQQVNGLKAKLVVFISNIKNGKK